MLFSPFLVHADPQASKSTVNKKELFDQLSSKGDATQVEEQSEETLDYEITYYPPTPVDGGV